MGLEGGEASDGMRQNSIQEQEEVLHLGRKSNRTERRPGWPGFMDKAHRFNIVHTHCCSCCVFGLLCIFISRFLLIRKLLSSI